jgi:GNAT superfamily N-acetyltransferase
MIEKNEQVPGVDEYCTLRVAAGLSARTAAAAARGLPGTLYAVCFREQGDLLAMGRVIGDGGLNFEVVDVAVHPNRQRQGLGSKVMESLMLWLRENAPRSSYVCLIADHGAPALYEKFGFRETAPVSVGMAIRL